MIENVLRINSTIPRLQPEIELPLTRVGRNHDGGYVVPSLVLENTTFLFSGGYGNDFSFEKDFLSKSKASSVFLYDFSITMLSLISDCLRSFISAALRRSHYPISYHLRNILTYLQLKKTPRITLIHKKLSVVENSDKSKITDLTSAFNSISTNDQELFFCKLDIEGSEYELINELVILESRISGLVVEFHDTYSRRATFINSLHSLSGSYAVVHTHVNNYGGISIDGQPKVYEISLLNRRFLSNLTALDRPNKSLVPLDQPNDPDSAEVELIFKSSS